MRLERSKLCSHVHCLMLQNFFTGRPRTYWGSLVFDLLHVQLLVVVATEPNYLTYFVVIFYCCIIYTYVFKACPEK